MRVAIYIRVSTLDQAREGYSLITIPASYLNMACFVVPQSSPSFSCVIPRAVRAFLCVRLMSCRSLLVT